MFFQWSCVSYNESMIIKNNAGLKKGIYQFLKINRFNVEFSEALIRNIFIQSPLIKDRLELPNKGSDLIKFLEDKIESKLAKQGLVHATKNLLNLAISNQVNLLNPNLYLNNPFANHTLIASQSSKGWRLVQESYRPFQMFVCGDVTTNEKTNFLEKNPIGFFKEPFQYLALKKNNVIWMSITPFEIETMKATLSAANGTVIALGLGLGYFATMAAMKLNVDKIIVVEKDIDVITLYQRHLQSILPNQHKITIIQADAYEYLQGTIKADHIFVDIYRTSEDGLPIYNAFKKIEMNRKDINWHYWLQDSILGLFRRYLMIYLDEQLQGLTNDNYQPTSRIEDKILAQIHLLNQNVIISSLSQIRTWLSDENIKEMLGKIDLD